MIATGEASITARKVSRDAIDLLLARRQFSSMALKPSASIAELAGVSGLRAEAGRLAPGDAARDVGELEHRAGDPSLQEPRRGDRGDHEAMASVANVTINELISR